MVPDASIGLSGMRGLALWRGTGIGPRLEGLLRTCPVKMTRDDNEKRDSSSEAREDIDALSVPVDNAEPSGYILDVKVHMSSVTSCCAISRFSGLMRSQL